MASGGGGTRDVPDVHDVDLIDLESGVTCSSSNIASRAPSSDATPEEQEHLLDVCPPKLEQKLSLTRRSHDFHLSSADESNDGVPTGSVLVTLGHDQVVPVRKRIDVVSSDTIRRVRDITKNLEPVIRPRMLEEEDHTAEPKPTIGPCEEDASYEAREISDAFNFLSELEDNDEDEEEEKVPCRPHGGYPLEPTCLIKNSKDQWREAATLASQDFVFDNQGFESSPPGADSAAKKQSSLSFDFDGLRVAKNSFKRLRSSFTCSVASVGLDTEPWRKRSKNCNYRKSWSEGSVSRRRNKADGEAIARRIRTSSASFDEKKLEGKEKLTGRGKSSSSIRASSSGSVTSGGTSPSSSSPPSSSSSSCSEVDWSWVEEVEPTVDQQQQQPPIDDSPSPMPCKRRRRRLDPPTRAAGEGAAMTAAGAALTETGGRMRGPETAGRESRASVAMSVAAAGKSDAPVADVVHALDIHVVQQHQQHLDALTTTGNAEAALLRSASNSEGGPQHNGTLADVARVSAPALNEGSTSGTLPWLRASMRRLRQLRLPDGSSASVSAPNSLPDIALIAPEILAAQTNDTTGGLLRPSSAPAPTRGRSAASPDSSAVSPRRGRRSVASGCRQQPAGAATGARMTGNLATDSVTTTCDSSSGTTITVSSGASSPPGSPLRQTGATNSSASSPRRLCGQRDVERDEERAEDDDEDENSLGKWPHALSSAFACLGCTLGLFNISRFAILSIQFGANFITQFLILSLVIGIPLLTLQVCLGQRLSAGVVDMWKISPLFQGVGIALLVAQAFIGIYSIVGISWMLVYFRDSFITKLDKYRWSEPFPLYREDARASASSNGSGATGNTAHNHSGSGGGTPGSTVGGYGKLPETVPDYFNGVVLQRLHLNDPDPGVVTLKFQVAFNLAVVWMVVFVSLSKGLRSYGKVVYVFTALPVFSMLLLCVNLLGVTPTGSINQLFPATAWNEFFVNGRSWAAAASEVFLTWGLLGAAAMQVAAHNKHKHMLQRDTSLVIVLTLMVLLLAAFLANTCVQILRNHGYYYVTSSFERMPACNFLRSVNQPAPVAYSSTPERFMAHASFLVGQRVTRPGSDLSHESGYQALRLATELVPATLAVLGPDLVSPFFAVLFYFILILFGIAQQLAIWHCVITGIMAINTKMMKLWETTITFFSCACAYVLGLPMTTELGIYVVYYLDYTVGGAWWIMLLYLVQVGAVFAVRGRPHTGDAVVTELFPPTGRCLRYWAAPLLSFTWNVILPISLMILSITIFKSAGYRDLFTYRRTSKDYWAIWARQLGASIQLIPLLIIPVVALIQTCRYLNTGPPDIFDNDQVEVNVSHCNHCNGRIQLLYRPPLDPDDAQHGIQTQVGGAAGVPGLQGNGLVSSTTELPFEDPPPKYTPPPSYTTATGARIAKMLRQSFRRSVRRIANVLGEGGSGPRQRPTLQQQPPPPDYAAVLVEMNQSVSSGDVAVHVAEVRPDVADTRHTLPPSFAEPSSRLAHQHHRSSSTICRTTSCRPGVSTIGREAHAIHRGHYTVDRRPHHHNPPSSSSSSSSNLTAAEVANLLRSSIRRGTTRTQHTLRRSFHHHDTGHCRSGEAAASVVNLVEAAAPIGQDSLLVPKSCANSVTLVLDNQHQQQSVTTATTNVCSDEQIDIKKTAGGADGSVTVI